MIFRITDRLGKKIKSRPSLVLPADRSPYADWSGRLFTHDRIQYIMITNTSSLFTMIMYGRGISDEHTFLEQVSHYMGEFLCSQGHELIFQRIIAPSMAEVSFSKALSRQVTGTMNELEFEAKVILHYHSPSPYELSVRLNDVLFSMLNYSRPREAFHKMAASNQAL